MDFRRRLEAMVSYAEQIGAMPVLIAPPASDAGFEPNRSFLPAVTLRGRARSIRPRFSGRARQEAVDPQVAIEAYRALLSRQPGFAEAHYRLAKLLEGAGSWDEAYHHYRDSRDLDGYPMHVPTAFQAAYREVAERHGCILIDGQAYFHAIGQHGLLDDHLFHDGMHPSLRGQIALAQAVLHELHAAQGVRLAPDHAGPDHRPGTMRTPVPYQLIRVAVHLHMGHHVYDLTYRRRYD